MTDELHGHIPGVPRCPDCGLHYTEGEHRRGRRLYWVAQCCCMSLRFDRFMEKVTEQNRLRKQEEALTALTAEAQEIGLEY